MRACSPPDSRAAAQSHTPTKQTADCADHWEGVDTPWRLALWDCLPETDGWTAAYTVQSVLVQLQALLLDDDLHFATGRVRRPVAVWGELGPVLKPSGLA